jgi:hypothetical protein
VPKRNDPKRPSPRRELKLVVYGLLFATAAILISYLAMLSVADRLTSR